jgi:ABC-type polysaccharide/polyol phosphate export permease
MRIETTGAGGPTVRSTTLFGFKPGEALRDITDGWALWRIWLNLSWQEFRGTYRRSALGIFWVVLSFAGFVGVKLFIFSSLLHDTEPGYYDAYLLTGFFVWMFLSQSTTAAPQVFVSARGWIKSEALPFSLYIYKDILREFYNLILTSSVVIVAIMLIGFQVKVTTPYSLLAVVFFLVNAFFYKLLFGIIGARIRDVGHLVRAVMMPMLFLTPIFWQPDQMGGAMKYLWWNPFFHYLEIFRAPILDGHFPVTSWIFSLSVLALTMLASLVLFARYRQRIVFWL